MDGEDRETDLDFLAGHLVTASRCLVTPNEPPFIEHEGKRFALQRDGRFITKHIYAGQTRIASKMDPDWFRDPPTIYHQPDHLGPVPFVTPTPASLRAGHLRDPIRVQFPRICVAAYSRAPGSGPI